MENYYIVRQNGEFKLAVCTDLESVKNDKSIEFLHDNPYYDKVQAALDLNWFKNNWHYSDETQPHTD